MANVCNMNCLDDLLAKWPSTIVAREEVGKLTGGLINPRTLANLDCRGEGVKGAFKIGKKVVYPVKAFIAWLKQRAEFSGYIEQGMPKQRPQSNGVGKCQAH